MSILTITHDHADGTVLHGTTSADAAAIKQIRNPHTLAGSAWRWSRRFGAWYVQRSRDRVADQQLIAATVTALEAAGYTVTVEIDDNRRAVADIEADRADRAEQRADGLAAKADRLHAVADAAADRERTASAAVPPFGEPIKTDHYSAPRHRKSLEKARAALSASVAADQAAARADRQAATAATAAERRVSAPQIRRRLDRLTTDLRAAERARDGHTRTLYVNPATGARNVETTAPAAGAYRDRVLGDIARLTEEIAYWTDQLGQLAAAGEQLWSKDTVAKGDIVYRGDRPFRVVRCNAKTAGVEGEFGWDHGSGKLPYDTITRVTLADGTEVRIVDGQRSTTNAGE